MEKKTIPAIATVYRHQEYPFIICHPDGIIHISCDSYGPGVELKHVEQNENMWGDKPEQLPQFHYLQIQHSMVASGFSSWWYYCEIPKGGQGKAWLDFRCHEFVAEPKIHAAIIEICISAWKEIGELHAAIQAGGSSKDDAINRLAEMAKDDAESLAHAAKMLYPYTPKPPTPAPANMLIKLRELANQNAIRKAAEQNEAELRAQILLEMCQQDAATWSGEFGKVARTKKGLTFTGPKGE